MSKTDNREQLDTLQKRLNRKIEGYLNQLAKSEQTECEEAQGTVQEALKALRTGQKKLDTLSERMDNTAILQWCETEREANTFRA